MDVAERTIPGPTTVKLEWAPERGTGIVRFEVLANGEATVFWWDRAWAIKALQEMAPWQ